MSHYAVYVITNEKPTDEIIEKAMAPFHEFECTGRDDEYILDVDITEDVREEYETETRSFVTDGTQTWSKYDDICYRDPTPEEKEAIGFGGSMGWCKGFSYRSQDWGDGQGYRPKVHEVPAHMTEVEKNMKDYMTFREFAEDYYSYEVLPEGVDSYMSLDDLELQPEYEDPNVVGDFDYNDFKYGYITRDDRVIRRTNPNAKWDWYVIGGRWDGVLVQKDGQGTNTARHKDIDWDTTNAPFTVVLPGGKWVQKGDMGWWGVVHDEKEDWNEHFKTILTDISPDAWFTVVDCHT